MELYRSFKDYVREKFYGQLAALPAPLREAEIFSHICELIPIDIFDGDLIGGRYAVCEEESAYACTHRTFPYEDALSAEEKTAMADFLARFRITARFDKGHFAADYESILRGGLKSYRERIEKELATEGLSEEKRTLLRAMLVSVDATKIYTARFAALAEKKYLECGGEWLKKLSSAYKRVPFEPAENIHEAICAVWIIHSLLPISDDSWASISLGRIDQYLYPCYEKSLSEGESRESVKEYLKCLFGLLNCYGDGACALNVGGLSPDGEDETNELTYLLCEVEKEIALPSPILAVRVHADTPEALLSSVIDRKLFSIGQPTFYGECACRRALVERGLSEEDAKRFTLNSCMGIYRPGEEIASMWGVVFNMHLPLELAINGGAPIARELPIRVTERKRTPESLSELFEEYEGYLEGLLSYLFAINRKNAKNRAAMTPNPLLSALTEGCIERGLDRALGAKYNTETVETVALVNTANAIAAIDTLVFKAKKYTLEDFVYAARVDFAEKEKLLADIKRCEKYGSASAYADGIVRRIVEMTAAICKKYSHGNVYFLPSLHTLDLNVTFGANLYTTLDGRLAGEPVAKNAGPTNETRTSEPTKLILSATSIRQELFSGGQPIDVYFDGELLDSREGKDKIASLVKTYAALGGMQFQANSIDPDLLEAAYEHPERYPQIVVRIGGYSLRFVTLSRDKQREFIERFKKESGR